MVESLPCCSPIKARRKGRHLVVRLLDVQLFFYCSWLSHHLRFYNRFFHHGRQFNYFRLRGSLRSWLWGSHLFWCGLRLNCSININYCIGSFNSFRFWHTFRSCFGLGRFGFAYLFCFSFFGWIVFCFLVFNYCIGNIIVRWVIMDVYNFYFSWHYYIPMLSIVASTTNAFG